jgi:hypothetical protein
LAFVPGMSAGTPGAASKKTLCATEPNANVTVPPAARFSGDGLKEMFGEALIVALVGGGEPVAGAAIPPPQAVRRARQMKEDVRGMFMSEGVRALETIRQQRAGRPSPEGHEASSAH